MTRIVLAVMGLCLLLPWGAEAAEMSDATAECLECHQSIAPGMVKAWQMSRHAQVSPAQALQKPALERRVSAAGVPKQLLKTTVGCAECHTLNAAKHRDVFEHNGYQVHVLVTPGDCATCHPVEAGQYKENIMSQAYGNLKNNTLYRDLTTSINGVQSMSGDVLTLQPQNELTDADSCYSCHGTRIELEGMQSRDTEMGEMDFPVLSGWPNEGVGRLNPDGTVGSCASCHTMHRFSIEMARKPHTCAQCHSGPDVPAYKVYKVSKHGNVYNSLGGKWDFAAVPWTVGRDFTAPTCAACHVSLVATEEGGVLAERSHQMSDRLSWRIFGLIYAHAYPKSADTSIIRNSAGQPLPTDLNGKAAASYLIDGKEQQKRTAAMQAICLGCHSQSWVVGHWQRFENTIETTNAMTLTATRLMQKAWAAGLARGPEQKDSIFNEAIERKWAEQWLFFANTVRFSSAMLGTDYGAFANGRWYMSKTIMEMDDWLRLHSRKVQKTRKK
ncbi:MAG: hydroxylamine oxidase [Deltaproteobacteria bacterium]|nr:hydroxylamine oxidase [Deltaproteobacteria bacterium]